MRMRPRVATVRDGAQGGGTAPHEEYDRKLLLSKLLHLQRVRTTNNPREMMLALRIDLIRNVANIAKRSGPRRRANQHTTWRLRGQPQQGVLRRALPAVVRACGRSQKHRQNFVSVPAPIQQYIREVQEQLDQVRPRASRRPHARRLRGSVSLGYGAAVQWDAMRAWCPSRARLGPRLPASSLHVSFFPVVAPRGNASCAVAAGA